MKNITALVVTDVILEEWKVIKAELNCDSDGVQ